MVGMNKLLAVGALVVGLLLPAQAMAAYQAHTRVDLNLRIGPATSYGVIDVIPAGHPVTVIGCLDDYSWCDIDFVGLRGWVAASYLVQPGTAVYLPRVAPQIGLPVIGFSFDIYHDRHYRGRPWHRQRAGSWRGHRQVHRSRPRQREVIRERRPRADQRQRRQQVQQPRQRQRTEQRQRRQQVQQPRQRQRAMQRQQRRVEQRQRGGSRTQQRSRSRTYEQQRSGTPRYGRAAGQ